MSLHGTPYQTVSADYFTRREMRRYAGGFSLWALGVGAWFALGIAWLAPVGRHRLVLSPEEAFAMEAKASVAD